MFEDQVSPYITTQNKSDNEYIKAVDYLRQYAEEGAGLDNGTPVSLADIDEWLAWCDDQLGHVWDDHDKQIVRRFAVAAHVHNEA